MKRTLKAVGVLFKKDFKDTLQNMNVMILIVLPLLFGVLYTNIFGGMVDEMMPNFVLNLVTGMTLALIPTSFLSVLVAEEKEKNTLRALMLSGVTAVEFILSKMLLTLLLLETVSIASFFVTGSDLKVLPFYILFITMGSVGLLLIGATIGLLCKDQMSTGVLSTPIALLLLLPPMLGGMNDILAAIAEYTPIEWVIRLTAVAQNGGTLVSAEAGKGVLILVSWIILPAAIFGLVYRQKRLD